MLKGYFLCDYNVSSKSGILGFHTIEKGGLWIIVWVWLTKFSDKKLIPYWKTTYWSFLPTRKKKKKKEEEL